MCEINVESGRFGLEMFHKRGTACAGEERRKQGKNIIGVNKCEQSGMGENIVIHIIFFFKVCIQ